MSITELRKESLLSPTEKVKELVVRFGEVQEELKESMASVSGQNSEEIETGWFDGIRGKTDAQIASHVKTLGLNLHTTQKVVMFLIELSHAKNEVLRGFHDTLVSKLIELDKEHDSIAGDLSVSQDNERKIVNQIKEQIEGRLAMQDSIDANASSITDNQEKIIDNHTNITRNTAQIRENMQLIGDNQTLLSGLGEELQNKSEIDNGQSVTLVAHQHAIDELAKQLAELQQGTGRNISASKKIIHLYGVISVVALVLALAGLII